MNTSILCKDNNMGKIVFMEYDTNPYIIDEIKSLNIKNIAIYFDMNKDSINNDKIVSMNIPKETVNVKSPVESAIEFRMSRLAQVIFRLLYQDIDDTDDGDCFILLDEVAKLKSIIEIKFKLELGIEKYREYINNLSFLDKQLRNKIAAINYQRNIEEKGHAR